jgi:hypothetical protein
LENSPKTPTLTLQSQTFLHASQPPPRSTRSDPRPNSFRMDQIPTYDYAANLAVPTSNVRHQFERDDQIYDASYFAEV